MSTPQELIEQATKKAQKPTGFLSFFSSGSTMRLEEASELCIQAANLYKLQKQLKEAGDAFKKAAEYQMQSGNEDDAGNIYVDAYKSYKSGNCSRDAVESLQNAITLFTKRGQFRRSANFKFELGEILEQDLHDYANAIKEFETAGEWYSQDQAIALANKSWLRCSDLLALDNKFLEASGMYSKIIANSVGNKLSSWALKEYYLKKALCQLAATDSVAAQRTLHEGSQEDPNFHSSREADFLQQLIEAYNDNDTEKLSNVTFEFDKFQKLDKWKTTILLKIKENISEAEDDLL